MAELFGLVFSLIFLAIIFLPVFTFLRLGRISRELDDLSRRLEALERRKVHEVPDVPQVLVPSPAADASPSAHVHSARDQTSAPGAPSAAGAPTSAHVDSGASDMTSPSELSPPDLEERIGGRGLLYVGVFVLLLGVSFFLKYAFDNEWVNPTARVLIGLVAGVTLVIRGLRLATAGLATFGQALVGTGFAVLYLVVYAALNFYYLIERGAAFAMMVVVTIAAATVAHRHRAQALAFIAAAGGFLTPALAGGEDNAQLTLFTYVAILVLGTMLLSLRHQWPGLNAISYIGTLVMVVAWAARHYSDDQWLRTLLFLTLFCVAFLIILRETRRAGTFTARVVGALLWTAPLLYHIAAIVITAGHPPAIHIYLIALTAAGLWTTVDPHRPWLRCVLLLAAFIPMFGTSTLPAGGAWLLANLVTIVAVAVLHVMALVDRTARQDGSLRGPELLTLHLAGLGLFSLLYERLEPHYPEFRGALALFVAAGVVMLGRTLRPRDDVAWLNALALAFTLVAIGIAVQFDGPPVVIGWAAEGVAAAWLGVRTRHRAFQFGGFVLWTLATLQLFDSFADTPAGFTALLNTRAFAALFVLICGYVMAWRLSASTAPESTRMRTTLHIVASALTVAWLTAEIQSFWAIRPDTPQAHLSEQMLLSLAWGAYGALLIVVGLARRYALLRYIGIAIIAITSLKVFFYDLWELGGIYRVIGFLAFGVLLVLVSYLYQNRRRLHDARPDPS